MIITYPRPRILPVTIIAMALLLTLKSVGLLRAALAGNAVAAETPAISAPEASAAQTAAATAATPGARITPPVEATMRATPAMNLSVATASAPPPPVSDAERSLLLDLRHRRDMLDTRARAQEQRDGVMAAAEKKLAARVAELNALQGKLEALEAARQSHDNANWTSLVRIYETMKPRDAATIFDALDMQVLLGVLDRMSERKAAPILAAMQPDRARLATQLLAELRTRSVTPAGEPPAGAPGRTPASQTASDPKG